MENNMRNLRNFVIFCLVLTPFSVYLRIHVIHKLYDYFLLQITGISLSWWLVFGLVILIGYTFNIEYRGDKNELSKYLENEDFYKAFSFVFGKGIICPLGVWLIGYVAYCFI